MHLSNLILLGLLCAASICKAKKQDYYKTLGIAKGASAKDIKKAFRKMALKYHPDKNPDKDTTKQFRQIAEAYEVLGDEDKRRQYDAKGHNAWGSADSGGFKPGNFNFDDLFKGFDDEFFKDMRGHFSNHFSSHKAAHESAGGAFNIHDNINFEDFFNTPFGHHHDADSNMFGRDMDMFGSSQNVKVEMKGGQRCKTVTQQVGNTRTTYTQCS